MDQPIRPTVYVPSDSSHLKDRKMGKPYYSYNSEVAMKRKRTIPQFSNRKGQPRITRYIRKTVS